MDKSKVKANIYIFSFMGFIVTAAMLLGNSNFYLFNNFDDSFVVKKIMINNKSFNIPKGYKLFYDSKHKKIVNRLIPSIIMTDDMFGYKSHTDSKKLSYEFINLKKKISIQFFKVSKFKDIFRLLPLCIFNPDETTYNRVKIKGVYYYYYENKNITMVEQDGIVISIASNRKSIDKLKEFELFL